MIVYKARGAHHFLHILQVEGSVFPSALVPAVPCAIFTVILKCLLDEGYVGKWLGEQNITLSNNSVWSSFNFLLGFLVVFRTSQAYVRFWEGITATHRMRAEWFDAVAAVCAFCKHSDEYEKISVFQNTLVRLFSMLHAVALAEIEDCNSEKVEDIEAFKYELVDGAGIDQASLLAVMRSETKVELVHQWIQQLIVENINTKVLSIPPPILSRVFQEVANGMVAFHEAIKISSIPFPFPYAQSCDLLLIIHTLLVPIITAQWVTTPWWAGVFAFVQVLVFWALNCIAVEMENPFGDDKNDMDMKSMQLEMNQFLLLLLSPEAQRTPSLAKRAVVVAVERRDEPRLTEASALTEEHKTIRERRESFFQIWNDIQCTESSVLVVEDSIVRTVTGTTDKTGRISRRSNAFELSRSLRGTCAGWRHPICQATSTDGIVTSYKLQSADSHWDVRGCASPPPEYDDDTSLSHILGATQSTGHVRFNPHEKALENIARVKSSKQAEASQDPDSLDGVTSSKPSSGHHAAPLRGEAMPRSALSLSRKQDVTRVGPILAVPVKPTTLNDGENFMVV